MKHLNVLIACEESQAECLAFRELGHKAYSCDVQMCRRGGNKAWHICGDCRPFLHGTTQFYTQDGKHHHISRWHLIIAHPPCTYLCKVGSQHLYKGKLEWVDSHIGRILVNPERYGNLLRAREFFMECLNANAPFVAVENPLPMALANLPQPDCFVQPFWFGDRWSKKTLYWLRNLPPIMPTIVNPEFKQLVHCSRGKYRSRTSLPLARAIAQQWADYAVKELGINYKKAMNEKK